MFKLLEKRCFPSILILLTLVSIMGFTNEKVCAKELSKDAAEETRPLGVVMTSDLEKVSSAVSVMCGDVAYIFTDGYDGYELYAGCDEEGTLTLYEVSFMERVYSTEKNDVACLYVCEEPGILEDATTFEYVGDVVAGKTYDVLDYMGNTGTAAFSQYIGIDDMDEYRVVVKGKYEGDVEEFPAVVLEDDTLVAIAILTYEGNVYAYNIWFDYDVFESGE